VTVEEPKVLRGGSVETREWRIPTPFSQWMRKRNSS